MAHSGRAEDTIGATPSNRVTATQWPKSCSMESVLKGKLKNWRLQLAATFKNAREAVGRENLAKCIRNALPQGSSNF